LDQATETAALTSPIQTQLAAGYHQANKAVDTAARTTTSTSFVDMTGMSIVLTTAAKRVLIGFNAAVFGSSPDFLLEFEVTIDGAAQGGGTLGISIWELPAASKTFTVSFTYLSAVLTAAEHTFKIQWKVGTDTGSARGDYAPTNMWVIELK
jgi:hypothetical protein